MAFDADVVVVGAGPVGCGVARALAARGLAVLVLERAAPGRDKPCGEGLLPHGVAAARRLGLPVDGPPFVGIRYVVGDAVADGTFPDGAHGVGCWRIRTDAGMQAAAAAVAELWHGAKVVGLGGAGGDLTVRTTTGAVRARLAIAADGARSTVRRLAGLDAEARPPRRWAVRRHFAWAGPLPERVEVTLGAGGEVYVTPVAAGVVNVAVLVDDAGIGAFRGAPDAALDRWLARLPGLASRLGPPVDGAAATGPLRQSARRVVADGVLLVGDAAGFVDGIAGEGTSLGLEGAELAAEVADAAVRTGRLSATDLAGYAERHRALVRRSHAITEALLALAGRPGLARAIVSRLARRPEVFDHLLGIHTGAARARDLPRVVARGDRGRSGAPVRRTAKNR